MLKKYAHRLGFACTLLAAASCGGDSGSDAAPPPSMPAAGVAGAPGVEAAPGAVTPAGEVTPGELPGAGAATPLDGAGAVNGGAAEPGGEVGASTPDGGAPPAAQGATSPFPSGVTRPRIMIVGDSISAGPGCYKRYLVENLNANGYSSFEFVGEYTDDCGGGVMHSARSCTTAFDYTQPTFTLREDCGGGTFPGLSALMTTHRPDLLMLQLGVNDVWNGQTTESILGNYSLLLAQARAENPSVVVAVAQIQQIRPGQPDAAPTPDGEAVFARAQQLIEAVPAWALAESQPGSPVFVADLWTNSDVAQTLDGVHPDEAGAQRMGLSWFEALRGILRPD